MRTIIATLHGILTGQTDPSWPDKFDAWMFERDPEFKVLKKEYRAGPFPRWNCWVKDPFLARSLANELELFLRPAPNRSGNESPPALWFVAHSNGAVIALLTAALLIERGLKVNGLILTGAACEADIDLNGVLEWQCRGALCAAMAYSSADDRVLADDTIFHPGRSPLTGLGEWLRGKVIWPYGSLGRTGWLLDGSPLIREAPSSGFGSPSLFTRWQAGGHSAWFSPENIIRTFEQFYRDITNE